MTPEKEERRKVTATRCCSMCLPHSMRRCDVRSRRCQLSYANHPCRLSLIERAHVVFQKIIEHLQYMASPGLYYLNHFLYSNLNYWPIIIFFSFAAVRSHGSTHTMLGHSIKQLMCILFLAKSF